ncbi:MAG: peptidylprolyl isomerase [Chloroflexi bacterium]|nr:MAG: peptidylprolyl isomerase [Chloroflexota bacterium]
MIIGGVLAVVVIVFVVWQLWPSDEAADAGAGAGVVVEGERPLAALPAAERNDYFDAPPENILEPGIDYQAIIRTENGDITLDLFEDVAPITVNSFVYLANQGFYDGTTFHRVLQDFMAQGGDPSGTGGGGPGYEFVNETDNDLAFDHRGVLAMANAGPDTNGSQFFITFTDYPSLNGGYTIFGEMMEGDDVLSAISLRDPQTATTDGDKIVRIDIVEKEFE